MESAERRLKLTLRVWRQDAPGAKGRFETYHFEIRKNNTAQDPLPFFPASVRK